MSIDLSDGCRKILTNCSRVRVVVVVVVVWLTNGEVNVNSFTTAITCSCNNYYHTLLALNDV